MKSCRLLVLMLVLGSILVLVGCGGGGGADNAIKEGKYFVIEDEKSTVYKRKCVTKRVPVLVEGIPTSRLPVRAVQLKVQNLRPYYEEFID